MKRSSIYFILLITSCAMIGGSAVAADGFDAQEAIQRTRFYQSEAEKLSSREMFAELERQRTILSIKNRNGRDPFSLDEDVLKGSGYATALEDRRKAGEPSAAFFYGVYNMHICAAMQGADNGQLGETIKNCWLDSLQSFKVASEAHIGPASFNIARMYEDGMGVIPSKFVAAEWYVKAAEQQGKDGSRDEALTSIEKALKLVPDHPAALRLKKVMLHP